MAPAIKRKAGADERPLKKARSGKVEDEKKLIAKGLAKAGKPGKAQEDTAGERKPVAKTVLSQEERSFPRGGASVLTPIEQKQIEARAERDVLFEQQTGQKPARREGDDDFFSEEEEAAAPKAGKNKKGKKGSGLKIAGSGIKIQSLSYKNLVVGSTVLGRVTAITGKDVAVALPNNLTGYVPITAVSARLNDRIESPFSILNPLMSSLMWAEHPPSACEWSQPWYGMYTSRPVQLIIPGGQDVGGLYRTVSVSAYVRLYPNLCRYIHVFATQRPP